MSMCRARVHILRVWVDVMAVSLLMALAVQQLQAQVRAEAVVVQGDLASEKTRA